MTPCGYLILNYQAGKVACRDQGRIQKVQLQGATRHENRGAEGADGGGVRGGGVPSQGSGEGAQKISGNFHLKRCILTHFRVYFFSF